MASIESTLVNSIVGTGTFFKGQIEVSGLLRIDGDFAGSVKTSGRVIVGRSGRADCTIDAATVVIGGVFRGTVYASEKVIALESAIIFGNVFAPRLIAESGVLMDGTMHVRGAVPGRGSGDVKGSSRASAGADDRSVSDQTAARSRWRSRKSSRRRVPLGNL